MSFYSSILNAQLGIPHIFAVGQAGYVVKSASGQLFGIDLYLSECVERVEGHDGFKRLLPKILSPFDLVFDCLVTTHPHYDHFDMDSVPQLMSNARTRLFASVNCQREVERLLMLSQNISYIQPGNVADIGDFHLRFTTCDHGIGAPDAVGVVLSVDGKRLFFAGDTCLHTERAAEYTQDGPIDVLVAPINGAYGNLNEEECALLAQALHPQTTIPSHYGMFASHGGNPGLFIEKMREQKLPYHLMCQGERFDF